MWGLCKKLLQIFPDKLGTTCVLRSWAWMIDVILQLWILAYCFFFFFNQFKTSAFKSSNVFIATILMLEFLGVICSGQDKCQ